MPRRAMVLQGALQGGGFRPMVCLLARSHGLVGGVRNLGAGLAIEVEGHDAAMREFALALTGRLGGALTGVHAESLPTQGDADFVIWPSATGGDREVIPWDRAPCAACLWEISTPGERRYRYPFTSCASCGPRFTILHSLPYDRDRTAMAPFPLCPACQQQYANPEDRRFHAQTIACPACGPRLTLLDADGAVLATADTALRQAAALLASGGLLAMKGIGGFQLLCAAGAAAAIARLRIGKQRPGKPFAMMFPRLEDLMRVLDPSPQECEVLCSPAAPIVLLRRTLAASRQVHGLVAPRSPLMGVMLPSSPLHHLLLAELAGPLVVTSGNRRSEPMALTAAEALARLAGLADAVLTHDREIVHRADDPVVRVVAAKPQVLRLGRGLAPLSLTSAAASLARGTLALGGHEKNTCALVTTGKVMISPHLGTVAGAASQEAAMAMGRALSRLSGIAITGLAHDAHPDYGSTEMARAWPGAIRPRQSVQHHHAHVLAACLEHGLTGAVLGVAFDGTGFAPGGVIRGGELLRVDGDQVNRLGSLRPFPLPGGELAVREPRRAALGLLYATLGPALADQVENLSDLFSSDELRLLLGALSHGIHCPLTTSVGRLFDGVAALLGLGGKCDFEAEAALLLEDLAAGAATVCSYQLPWRIGLDAGAPGELDFRPLIAAILAGRAAGASPAAMAAGFYQALAEAIATVAEQAKIARVVLTGGVFQSDRLTRLTSALLLARGFQVWTHQALPAGDGGLAAGQAAFAIAHAAAGLATAAAPRGELICV